MEEKIVELQGCKKGKNGIEYVVFPLKERIRGGIAVFLMAAAVIYFLGTASAYIIFGLRLPKIELWQLFVFIGLIKVFMPIEIEAFFYRAEIDGDVLRVRNYLVTKEFSLDEISRYKNDKDFIINQEQLKIYLKVGEEKHIDFSMYMLENYSLLIAILYERFKMENTKELLEGKK